MMRRRLRSRTFLGLVTLALFAIVGLFVLSQPPSIPSVPSSKVFPKPGEDAPVPLPSSRPPVTTGSHPMWTLMMDAQKEFEEIKARQSKSLVEAVAEYRRRYGIPPPPNFDKWYVFAKERDVQLIDEFDTIHHSLTPFWGLKPKTIRSRAMEALGFNNNLLGLLIRAGNVTYIEGGKDWIQTAIFGMTKKFVQYLPDMDLCFNILDEPRVVVPHEDLAMLVAKAKDINMPAAKAVTAPRNTWSWRPEDMHDGRRIDETGISRFNRIPFQPTWTHSRVSCSPNSPARSMVDDEEVLDDVNSYAVGPLGFIYNHTAFSDICLSPSYSSKFGFFQGANAYNVVHDLFPIFSQSKISSYQDILYPSPWYWAEKVPYVETTDCSWQEKEDQMYWRGSTTGGFSRYGNWRRQHRQRFVSIIHSQDQAKILINKGTSTDPSWEVKSVFRPDYSPIFDIKFSEVGQCDRGDCVAQKQAFEVVSKSKPQEAWKSKYLLDIDGNAFSGRFYAFLRSRSLVFKLSIFREWHGEWIKPWVHYIPFGLQGDEWLEGVRWFGSGEEGGGKGEGERLALAGGDWARKALRNEDLETWFFRLLLEYGRLVDDDREIIGFS